MMMKWVVHIACIGGMRNSYMSLLWNLERKRSFGRKGAEELKLALIGFIWLSIRINGELL
jgi:hypothetical protein